MIGIDWIYIDPHTYTHDQSIGNTEQTVLVKLLLLFPINSVKLLTNRNVLLFYRGRDQCIRTRL